MFCPNLAGNSSLFTPFKFENWCPAWQPAGWREGGSTSHSKNHFFKYSWKMLYYLCLKKNWYKRYSLLNFLIMSFLSFISALDFILLDGAKISWNIWYFKSFLSINWYNFRGYLLSWGGSWYANFNFRYHWNLFKDIKSPTCKSKTIKFHLGQSYCLNIINLGSTR